MKQVELWGKAQRSHFGSAACDKLPAFARVMAMLVTERGRLATLQCVRSKIPLSGSGSDVGIDDCQAVVEELQRLKAGPKPETTSGGAGLPPLPQGASEGSSGGGLPPQEGTAEGGDFLALEVDMQDEDPIVVSARKLVDKELNHICTHTSKDTFDDDVVSRVLPTQKAIFLVDTVTSKQKVLNNLIEHCADLIARIKLARYVIACPVGSRVELLAGVLHALQKNFASGYPYVVQCTAGDSQNRRMIPSYIVMLSSYEDETVPATARINTVRAMAYEGLRLRCTTRSCRHRPQDADGQAEGICPDDQEAGGKHNGR